MRQEMKPEPRDVPEMLHSLLPYKYLKKDKRNANLAVGNVCLINQDDAVHGPTSCASAEE